MNEDMQAKLDAIKLRLAGQGIVGSCEPETPMFADSDLAGQPSEPDDASPSDESSKPEEIETVELHAKAHQPAPIASEPQGMMDKAVDAMKEGKGYPSFAEQEKPFDAKRFIINSINAWTGKNVKFPYYTQAFRDSLQQGNFLDKLLAEASAVLTDMGMIHLWMQRDESGKLLNSVQLLPFAETMYIAEKRAYHTKPPDHVDYCTIVEDYVCKIVMEPRDFAKIVSAKIDKHFAEMDRHVATFGLSHWKCLDKSGMHIWGRVDGATVEYNGNPGTYMQMLRMYDALHPMMPAKQRCQSRCTFNGKQYQCKESIGHMDMSLGTKRTDHNCEGYHWLPKDEEDNEGQFAGRDADYLTKLSPQTGDVLVLRVRRGQGEAQMMQQKKVIDLLCDRLKEQGIEVASIIVPDDCKVELLRPTLIKITENPCQSK